MRYYRGYPQRGAGLGNIIGSLFRAARPFLKTGLRAMLPVAARFGSRVLGDVAEGKPVRKSARRHAKKAGMDAISAVANTIRSTQRGRGRPSHIKKKRSLARTYTKASFATPRHKPFDDVFSNAD